MKGTEERLYGPRFLEIQHKNPKVIKNNFFFAIPET